MADTGKPDLSVGLITTRDARGRPAGESAGIVAHVVEVTAIIENVGDAVADETITRFWLRGAKVDRELRIVHTPEILPGDAVEVTALWDLRDGSGKYTIIVTADAFSQLDKSRTDNSTGKVQVVVRDVRVELA
jgi:hypothetical protein